MTAASIDASDPDSAVLTFTVSNLTHGRFVQIATGVTVTSFTQAQIAAGEIGSHTMEVQQRPQPASKSRTEWSTTAIQSVLFDFRYLNTAPSIASQTFTLPENTTAGAVVGQVIANDPDPPEVLSYSISGGPSNSLFTINSSSGNSWWPAGGSGLRIPAIPYRDGSSARPGWGDSHGDSDRTTPERQ